MSVISMKNLLETGVHFGHQTRKWNPKMAPFVFTARNGIHIIDLQKTVQKAKEAYDALKMLTGQGKKVLFVGTKKQARGAIEREAERCNMFYISNRWPGGLLTNWNTVRKSIARLKKLEEMERDNTFEQEVKTKKEILSLRRELDKLRKTLGGIKDMVTIPEIMFVIDPKKEEIAVKEGRKLGLTIFAVIDTNCDPELIDYPIPGNDDAIRAISLFLETMSNAVIEGTGGVVEQPKFSEDLDSDALALEYQGEYDESGRFIKDDDLDDGAPWQRRSSKAKDEKSEEGTESEAKNENATAEAPSEPAPESAEPAAESAKVEEGSAEGESTSEDSSVTIEIDKNE